MKWFKINGREYNVSITGFKEDFTVLYTENTGRTLDEGAPLVLDPLGTFFNYEMTVNLIVGYEDDFDDLYELMSQPSKTPLRIVLPRTRKTIWRTKNDNDVLTDGFDAYVSSGSRSIKWIRSTSEGELDDVGYSSYMIKFTATKAQVLPDEE